MKLIKIASFSLAVLLAVVGSATQSQARQLYGDAYGDDNATQGVNDSSAKSFAVIEFKAPEGVVTPPVDPENPDITNPDVDGTGNKGPLSLDYVANFDFGVGVTSTQTQSYYAKESELYVQVTDLRGASTGWTLSATLSPFLSGGYELSGAEIALSGNQVKTTSNNVSLIPLAPENVVLRPNTATTLMIANQEATQGEGTWVESWLGNSGNNQSAKLTVLGNTARALAYQATIDWTLSVTPS